MPRGRSHRRVVPPWPDRSARRGWRSATRGRSPGAPRPSSATGLPTLARTGNQKGVTTGFPLPNLPELPVEPVIFLLHMVTPERFPLPIEVHRSQVQHRLRPIGMPAHPRPLQPVLDQVPTRPLDHSTADRITCRKVLVITHPGAVPIEVADDFPHRLAAGAPWLSPPPRLAPPPPHGGPPPPPPPPAAA